ncbi:NADH:flavin oxidoreductase [Mycobacterium sp. JS623]|nr:NADH:flavin oxidoreductase [Mycobacterium sp. JS623]AGB25861.1 NADH:flavin oxidoreductase [Mycobacterium sp. JS623]
MARGFTHLLRPGRIGSMTLRNRLVMSPMETMYGTPLATAPGSG